MEFSCPSCEKQFPSRRGLVRHKLLHKKWLDGTDTKRFGCSYCDWKGRTGSERVIHTRGHIGEKPFQCPECDATFTSNGIRTKHFRQQHSTNRPTFVCTIPECAKQLANAETLKAHMEMHSGFMNRRKYICPITNCDQSYCTNHRLKLHMKFKHQGAQRPHSCSYCNKKFEELQGLIIHLRSHTDEKPYSCSICKRKFAQAGNLRRHEESYHSDEHERQCDKGCPQCDKRFKDPSAFRRHLIETHQKTERWLCSVCGKELSCKRSLGAHTTTHLDKNEYKHCCNYCGKKFAHGGNLERHFRIHTGEKPYGCGTCPSRFGSRGDLKCHETTVHRGERRWGCKYCKKAFGSSGNLNKHLETHKTDKDRRMFACPKCDKMFKSQAGQKLHIVAHGEEKNTEKTHKSN